MNPTDLLDPETQQQIAEQAPGPESAVPTTPGYAEWLAAKVGVPATVRDSLTVPPPPPPEEPDTRPLPQGLGYSSHLNPTLGDKVPDDGRVWLGTICPMTGLEFQHRNFFWSWHQMVRNIDMVLQKDSARDGVQYDIAYMDQGTTFTAVQRSEAAKQMVGNWLFYVDTDTTFPADQFSRMITSMNALREAHGRCDNLTGLYFSRAQPHHPVLRRFDPGKQHWPPLLEYPTDRPFIVDGSGGGILLIQKYVIEACLKKFGTTFDWLPNYNTEDLPFFLRCLQLGFVTWCDPRIESKHLQSVEYGSEDWNGTREVTNWREIEIAKAKREGQLHKALPDPRYLTPEQAVGLIGVPVEDILAAMESFKVRGVKREEGWRIDLDSLVRWWRAGQ